MKISVHSKAIHLVAENDAELYQLEGILRRCAAEKLNTHVERQWSIEQLTIKCSEEVKS